jgi:hypothetical protein
MSFQTDRAPNSSYPARFCSRTRWRDAGRISLSIFGFLLGLPIRGLILIGLVIVFIPLVSFPLVVADFMGNESPAVIFLVLDLLVALAVALEMLVALFAAAIVPLALAEWMASWSSRGVSSEQPAVGPGRRFSLERAFTGFLIASPFSILVLGVVTTYGIFGDWGWLVDRPPTNIFILWWFAVVVGIALPLFSAIVLGVLSMVGIKPRSELIVATLTALALAIDLPLLLHGLYSCTYCN